MGKNTKIRLPKRREPDLFVKSDYLGVQVVDILAVSGNGLQQILHGILLHTIYLHKMHRQNCRMCCFLFLPPGAIVLLNKAWGYYNKGTAITKGRILTLVWKILTFLTGILRVFVRYLDKL